MLYNIIDHIALPNIDILIYDTDLLLLIKILICHNLLLAKKYWTWLSYFFIVVLMHIYAYMLGITFFHNIKMDKIEWLNSDDFDNNKFTHLLI